MTEETQAGPDDSAVVVAQKPAHKQRSFLQELPFLVAIAFGLALVIKFFLVQAFYIPSGSMENTLQVGDRVLVNKIPYHYRGPQRGEIVVFNGLDNFDDGVTFAAPTNPVSKVLHKLSSTIGLGAPDGKDYIKRVIGLPGDHVMCCDAKGRVVVTTPDGVAHPLTEPYLFQDNHESFCAAGHSADKCPPGALGVLVPKGRLWVMGDHRGDSADSRAHLDGDPVNHGTVPENKVVGKAFTIVYPLSHAGFLHVPHQFQGLALPSAPYLGGALGVLPVALLRRRRLRR